MEKIQALEQDGRIDFANLPVIEPRIREILLKWLSNAVEDSTSMARTERGRRYFLDRSREQEKCVIHCEVGNLTMPHFQIVFQEEVK